MAEYVLAFKPAIPMFGSHDPSAAIFEDGSLKFGIEEERLTRTKHAEGTFPKRSIEACLDRFDLELADVDSLVVPYLPELRNKIFTDDLRRELRNDEHSLLKKLGYPFVISKRHLSRRLFPLDGVRDRLSEIGTPIPAIEMREHHACHAASAFHPSGLSEALVVTIDGRGEYDSTVVWHGTPDGLERLRTFEYPNSLGHFFGVVTEYLGYRSFNGEGKVMGLAPYGEANEEITSRLRSVLDTSAEYDVTDLTEGGIDEGVDRLESLFDRPRNRTPGEFDQWEKDLAYAAQRLLEETVERLVAAQLAHVPTDDVALAGGVALNCKLNKRIMQMAETDEVFIQPVAHDAGLAVGAGYLDQRPATVEPMTTVYWGPEHDDAAIESLLEVNKLQYTEPDDPVRYTAEQLADGKLVGWFQGRMEMGPRALGNRSILADPRTKASLDRVNEYVKHREAWRPFAPSMLEEAMDEYLVDAEPSHYMIKTFETVPDRRDDIEAVVHPADKTTRPQTVRQSHNPRYHRLISEFADITDVPVLLNTSFNDHAEPIVTTPSEAIKDFYGMGLDMLVVEDYVLEKAQ